MSMRGPPSAPPHFNIYPGDRSEKSKCPSQGAPSANGAAARMPDGPSERPFPRWQLQRGKMNTVQVIT